MADVEEGQQGSMPEMQMEAPKRTGGGKFWVVLLIIVVLAGLGYAAYYVITSGNSATTTTTEQGSLNLATPTGSVTSTADISTWKTYTNDTYGFSFDYPSDWTISEKTYSKQGDQVLTITSPKTAQKIADRTTNPFTQEDIIVRFATTPVTGDVTSNTIGVWMASQFTDINTAKNKTNENIKGAQAYGAELQADPGYYAILVQADKGLFALDFGSDAAKKSDLSTDTKAILSTFQFTK